MAMKFELEIYVDPTEINKKFGIPKWKIKDLEHITQRKNDI